MKKVNVSERRWRRKKSAESRADRRCCFFHFLCSSHDFLLSIISTRSALSSLTLVRWSWIDRRSRMELGQDTINRIFISKAAAALANRRYFAIFIFMQHESFSLCFCVWYGILAEIQKKTITSHSRALALWQAFVPGTEDVDVSRDPPKHREAHASAESFN